MSNYGLIAGGYPDKTTGSVTATPDEDIIPILKQNEIDFGHDFNRSKLELKEFAIKVNADTWIRINNGSEIPIFASTIYATDKQIVKSLKIGTAVGYSIAYYY